MWSNVYFINMRLHKRLHKRGLYAPTYAHTYARSALTRVTYAGLSLWPEVLEKFKIFPGRGSGEER